MSQLSNLTLISSFEFAPLSVAFGGRSLVVALESGEILRTENLLGFGPTKFNHYAKFSDARISGLSFDASGSLIATDTANQVVLKIDSKGRSETYVGDYESKPLLGPHALVVNTDNGQVFFTDSGLPGETGLHRPKGSLFGTNDLGQLVAISYQNLAYPASVALSGTGDEAYVAEKGRNRILRYVRVGGKIWEGTVFAQLSGGCGPVALAVTPNRKVIVAHSDLPHLSSTGKISVFNDNGEIEAIALDLPAPDVTDIELSPDGKKLLIAIRSTKSVYTYDVSN